MAGQIGIMQGRLSAPVDRNIQAFPVATWKEEFTRARQIGFTQIEWIFGTEDELNPILSRDGVAEIRAVAEASGILIHSLCADYFMHEPLLRGAEHERHRRQEKLVTLIEQCGHAGIRRLILPFVDGSRIADENGAESLTALIELLLPVLAQSRVELHLETSLAPEPFASLLAGVDSPWVKANYDTGNSAALGYEADEEFAAYGPRIGSVHIKDRLSDGGTVPLGSGAVDFARVAQLLRRVKYGGDFTLQVARDKPGNELEWGRHNLKYWQAHWLAGV